jgi:hypothetical protein
MLQSATSQAAKAVYEDLRLRFPQANGRKKEEDKK